MDLERLDEMAMAMAGVGRRTERGLWRWQTRGRLVARVLDPTHVVVRVPFDVRDLLVRQHPAVFSVPSRFASHMMVVADLEAVDADGAVLDAIESAWRLQSGPASGTS